MPLIFVAANAVLLTDGKAQTSSLEKELKALEEKIDSLPNQPVDNDSKLKEGNWIGHFAIDKESLETCTLKIENIKANFSRQIMSLDFENEGQAKRLDLPLDAENNFSEWQLLTMHYVEHSRFLDRSFNIKGRIAGNVLSGTFYTEVTRVGDSCSGEVYFVKKGTLEAKAYIEKRDPRVVKLEHKLAQLQKAQKSKIPNQVKTPKNSDVQIAKAVEELMRFRKLQKAEAARLAKLKAESKSEIKKLAALKKAQAAAQQAQQKKQRELALKRQQKQRASRLKIEKDFGRYHALIIGIDGYKNLPRLKTAIADAKAIATVLQRDYGFKVTKLLNPSRDQILDKIDDLRSKLTFEDNLLIYYSGHGQLDQQADEGYWLPVNAKTDRRSRWLSNNTLSSALRAFEAKHVMVVADSCYSGRLTRGISVRPRASHNLKFLKKLSRKKARVVLTSGGLKPVDDDNGSGHSPFADALLKALRENKGVFDGTSLFKSVHRPVQLDTRNQEPQYSDLRRAGHDGGDFIFVKGNIDAQ